MNIAFVVGASVLLVVTACLLAFHGTEEEAPYLEEEDPDVLKPGSG